MIKRLGETPDPEGVAISIKDAGYPAPFTPGLEFNAPVHGNWNIVHIGMNVPGARQIYVCADNCMRGVVLTAAEMLAADRFSFVILEEEHLLNGNLEDITIEGTADVIEKLQERPKMVMLFTVCLHHFLGCDLERVYEELEARFPDIFFARCYMDPIMQKHGLTPEQKLRKSMFDALREMPEDTKSVTLLGHDFSLDKNSDISRILKKYGYQLRQLPDCKTWEDYQSLSKSRLFLSCYPSGTYGARMQAERLNRNHLYLPMCFGYEEITRHLLTLARTLNLPETECKNWIRQEIDLCEKSLADALKMIGDTPIAIDYLFHPRSLGLARLLLTHGFCVKTVYLDVVSPEEKDDFEWLKEHAPSLMLTATIQPKMRVMKREQEEVLAIGQKAAWFSGSRHFVNMVQGGGLYGFCGIQQLADLMTEAFKTEKNTEDLVVRKGWGCDSCL